ncbi:MAG: nucleotide sugar dehydrogenase [Nanobdellota archaeon]
MKICVIGLGYVGLPLAMQASFKGHEITGVDKKQDIIEKTNNGMSHINEEFLNKLFTQTKITAKTKPCSSDAYIICVPTPVNGNKEPDLTLVKNATEEVEEILDDNQLVIIESTINPGVCEDVVEPILKKSNKKFLLAHCPERINPGDNKWNVSNIPRVVGGINAESTKKAVELYESIIDAKITGLSQIKAAEATKILENTFRDVNIAFINEMAQSFYRIGIDIKEVIKGASSKPFGFLPHYPGCGVGGHCIAIDPYYMIQRGKEAGFDHNFLIQARKINSEMPRYTVKVVQNKLNDLGYPINKTKIVVLGLSYKANVADDRESPSYEIIKILNNKKADIVTYDPLLLNKSSAKSLDEALKDAVCVIIATSHKEFLNEELYEGVKLVVDGRNCLDKNKFKKTVYRGIGVR